jgi:hypothetical protein
MSVSKSYSLQDWTKIEQTLCCKANKHSDLFNQNSGFSILREDRATQLERRYGFA